ncbi:MAG: IS21 family transposase [Planctomycetota bacterium]
MDEYGRIRRAHRDGMSIREIARAFRHSRGKIRQVLAEPEPRPYARNRPHCPKLGRFHGVIDQILADDERAPPKQRHTAMQVFRRLVAEHSYVGGYDAVRRYIGKRRRRARPTFIPLDHEPGQRQEADFGHIHVDFHDGRRQVPVLLLTWSYSHAPFAIAMPTERIEAVLSGMVAGFEFFGMVGREVWWDNPKTVVKTILKGRQRRMHERYAALASHYRFDPKFCMPASGWEKPHVENQVYDLQRRWATPVPAVRDLDELNAHLRRCCLAELDRTVAGQSQTIGERLDQDKAAALPLPAYGFDPCVTAPAKVDHYQRVQFDRARYSIPRSSEAAVTVKAYPDHVEIVSRGEVVARHRRRYDGGQELDPLHYLVTLGRRPAALDHSNVYRRWDLPAVFGELRGQLEQRHGESIGVRQYIRVLQLLAEHPMERVRRAIADMRSEAALDADRVRHRTEHLAAREASRESLDAANIPDNLGQVEVPLPDLSKFDQFLTTGEPDSCLTPVSCS